MGASIKVTKVDDNNFNVEFSQKIPGPSGVAAGDPIPLEWMHGVLDYYATHQNNEGVVSDDKIKRILPCW